MELKMNGYKQKKLGFMLAAAGIILAACLFLFAGRTYAAELTPNFESTDGSQGENILDNSNYTSEPFNAGTVLTLSSSDKIGYVYIKWDKPPGKWTLTADDKDISCGENDFLHELVTLSSPADSVNILIPDGGATIVDLYLYSPGDLPDDVQAWEPPCEEADVLLLSTHADDEVLFFGGIIPNYTNMDDVRVQVAYFTEHYSTGENMRMQEALDGLWTMGVKHYPQMGEFEDLYSESLEEAEMQYDHDKGLEYVVRTIRRFKPQVMIGQDLDGEYGHGCHRLTAKLITEAIEITDDDSQYPESAKTYGTWSVPKTYLHLYPEREIELDARQPLEKFGGKTALEIAKEAYLKHDSQQWCWFYVSDGMDENGNPDGYEYSCTKYGLFGTLVGDDTVTNDILDNITVYDKQTAEDREKATAEYETDENGEPVTDENGEAVTKAAPEPETDENGEVMTDENGEAVTAAEDAAASDVKADEHNRTGSGSAGKTILIIVIVIVVIIAAWLVLVTLLKRKRRRERAARRRRQASSGQAQRSTRASSGQAQRSTQQRSSGTRQRSSQQSTSGRRPAGSGQTRSGQGAGRPNNQKRR